MGGEIHTFVLCYEHVFVVRDLVPEKRDRDIRLEVYIHSKTVLDVVAKLGTTSEKSFQIDIHDLR